MKNTVAIAIIIVGVLLVYGGYKNLSIADTIRKFTGQKTTAEKTLGIGPLVDPSQGAKDKKIPGFTPNDSTK